MSIENTFIKKSILEDKVFYNDNKNNLLYLIILMICIVTSVQIMLNRKIIRDPIIRTSFKDDYDISNNIIRADSSKQTVGILVDAANKNGVDLYINGELVLKNVNGRANIVCNFGDVCTLSNAYEEDIKVYVNSSKIFFADEYGNLFSSITVRACSEVNYYLRIEK